MAKPVLKKTIAAGADELILLEDEAFEALDSAQTARALARAIEKLGGADLVLCGRQAADTDAGQVGIGVAAILDLPAVTVARKVEVAAGKVRVERVTADGHEVIEAGLPALVTASNEIGELRFPPVKATIAAQKVQPTVWTAADLGLDLAGAARTNLEKYYVPDRNVQCEMITGANPGEIAEGVAQILKTRIV
jgi:electron transfer flavoprotein beta subunit